MFCIWVRPGSPSPTSGPLWRLPGVHIPLNPSSLSPFLWIHCSGKHRRQSSSNKVLCGEMQQRSPISQLGKLRHNLVMALAHHHSARLRELPKACQGTTQGPSLTNPVPQGSGHSFLTVANPEAGMCDFSPQKGFQDCSGLTAQTRSNSSERCWYTVFQ